MKVIQQNSKQSIIALNSIASAINKSGDIVSSTLGPNGRNVLVGSKFTVPEITNDGLKVLNSIELENEVENEVVKLMKAEVKKTNDILGDSSTTTTTLMQSIFNAGFTKLNSSDFIQTTYSPNKVVDEIMNAKELIINSLKGRPIKKLSDLEDVALVSTEDEQLGKKIAEVVYKMGKDGIVKVEESQTIGIETEYIEGIEVTNGFISPYMANNDKGEAILDNPYILVCNSKIEDSQGLVSLTQDLIKEGTRKLVIFTLDIDPSVIVQMLSARIPNDPNNQFYFVVVKVSAWDKGMFEDISSVAGATLLDREKGLTLKNVNKDFLGKVSKIIVDSKKTLIIGGKKDIDISPLWAELKRTRQPFEKQKIEERIARLTGKIAVIRAGAQTEGKTSHLKDKLDDGINACKRALEGGVVKGGGLALYEIANSLEKNILTDAIKVPYNKIQESSNGIEIKDNVVDPLISIKTALTVACEFACNMLRLGTVIVEKNETDTK